MLTTRPDGTTDSGPCAVISPPRRVDGIICFGGEDWWYHNRGHYDMQMMRQAARRMPVLYVNSIGMRMPRPGRGRMFARRIGRKLASLGRGLVQVDEHFSVFSPLALPGPWGAKVARRMLAPQVRAAARRAGIRAPLVWVACPPAVQTLPGLDPEAVVYQRTDRYECFPGVRRDWIAACDADLKARADLTVFCASRLHRAEAETCRHAAYVDHGVDVERFVAAGRGEMSEPADLAGLPRPRIGFVGGIDAHTFDAALFDEVARLQPEMTFVLVGGCSLSAGWCDRPNVIRLGQRPFEDVPACMAACDVLIMPWRGGRWIEACNPVKLKEYLAVGRPVVSTPFAELRHYRGLVHVATSAGAFARAIREALARPGDPSTRRARVAGQTWNAKFDDVAQHLLEAGVSLPVAATSAVAARPAPHVVEVPLPRPAPTRRVAREASKRPDAAGQVRACIVLAGGLVPSPLVQATGRCVLDLWIGATETVLDRWVRRVGALAAAEESPIPIRVVHDAHGPAPWPREQDGHVRVELEPRPFRGPAGVLRDVCGAYGPDDEVVVVEAARDPQVELAPLVAAHRVRGAEVTVACDADGAPAGMYVVRCGALSSVAPAGYVDLKEQWLRGLCQEGRHVAVHVLAGAGAPPLRTPGQLLAAARRAAGASGEDEAWRVVCSGALIGPGAIVTGSIVMPGARIGAGSIVARSIVCAGTVVQAGTDIADAVVGVSRGLSDRRRDPASVTRDDHASGASIQALGEVERNA